MTEKPEVTPTDASSRGPLLFLLFSGLVWLVVAGLLGLVASIQLQSPEFLADCPFVTYGRMREVAETAFVYGWLANGGLALALWVLGRLAGEPLRAQVWCVIGTLFWNLSVLEALGSVLAGDATGFPLLGLPGNFHLIMFVSYGAIAVSGLLAWAGRLRLLSYASQWYAAAALFLFPWILSLAHVMLFSAPVRGVEQAVVAGWYSQCVLLLWLAPLALAVAYYVVPKMTGKALPSYEFASLGFWTLILVGGLTGGRHLIGGPVPAWLGSVAVVSFALLLFHALVVFLNLRSVFFGSGIALKFIAFGLAMYFIGAALSAATTFHSVAVRTEFTHFSTAQDQLALWGAFSTIFFGGIYYAVPRISGRAWVSAGLVRAHLFLSIAGILLLFGSLTVAGIIQSQDLADPKIAFEEITRHTHPWLLAATVAQAVFLLGSVAFAVNFVGTAFPFLKLSQPATFNQPSTMEAPVP
ncbi:MAG TPA: cbb3-type cytochrome c oxidase subunit I [Opitutaceae bacterium]|jgi:cytochrome c oxidase cbb3-type subunit 1